MSSATLCAPHEESSCTESPRSSCSLYAKSVLELKSTSVTGEHVGTRRKREFTPEEQKDVNYWLKRNRNNEAAKRSRQRKRMEEYILETRAVELLRENEKLKAALSAVQYGVIDVKNHDTIDGSSALDLARNCFNRSLAHSPVQAHLMLPSPASTYGPNKGMNGLSHDGFSDRPAVYYPAFCQLNPASAASGVFPKYCFPGNCDQVDHFTSAASTPRFPILGNSHPLKRDAESHLEVTVFHGGNYARNTYDVPVGYNSSLNRGTIDHPHPVPGLPSKNNLSLILQSEAAKNVISQEGPTGAQVELSDCANQETLPDEQIPRVESNNPLSNEKNEMREESPTIKTSECGPMLPLLPHKLRYKVSRTHQGHPLVNTQSVPSENKSVNQNYLNAHVGNVCSGPVAQWHGSNSNKSGILENNQGHSSVVSPPAHNSFSVSEAASSSRDANGSSMSTVVVDEMSENGLLRHQLASLCTELKSLKHILLARSSC